MFSLENVIKLFASFLAVVVVLTLHEFSHAFVAYKCGDPTPKWGKRLSLNPVRHFDLLGLLCFTFVGFGWAKPVAINPDNFKRYRLGSGLTASAGIVMNYLTAFLFYPLWWVVYVYYFLPTGSLFAVLLENFTHYLFAYSLSFCVFNLLPFFPLDGFRIVEACSRRHGKIYRFLRKYGQYILFFLVAESFICNVFVSYGVYQMNWFNILGYIMTFATEIFGWPITALWGLIL